MNETTATTKMVGALQKQGHFWKASDKFRAGIPDIVGCYRGRFVGVEMKVDYNHPSQIQVYTLLQIINNGGYAGVVTYNNRNKKWWIRGTGYDFSGVVDHILEKAATGGNDIE